MLVGVLLTFAEVAAGGDWRSEFRVAEEKLERGLVSEAKRELAMVLAAAESSHAGRDALGAIADALGRALFQAGEYRQAANTFERALRFWDRAEGRVSLLCNAVLASREWGDYGQAEKYAREAVGMAPKEGRAWQLLGSVLIREKRLAEAEGAERKAMELGSGTARNDLAMMYSEQGRYGEAEGLLQESLRTAKPGREHARLLANLGDVEQKLRRGPEGLAHLREALGEMEAAAGPMHPDVAGILELYSRALQRARRGSEAKPLAQRAKEIRSLMGGSVDWRDLK